jgi:molybdopterin converting factor small subunit
MRVYVKLFAFLADRASKALKEQYPEGIRSGSRLEVDLPEGATVENLVAELALRNERAKLIFVNGRAREIDHPLEPEDEVGIFPPVAGGEKEPIAVDVWLYGPLARYGGEVAGKYHANLEVQLRAGSRVEDLLKELAMPTEERGITFINGNLSAMPNRQPDLDHLLENGDRVAFFHLNSMWPFQYRDGATMAPGMSREMKEDKNRFHHRK